MATLSHDHLDRVQRRQLMRKAEGYLDLIMVFDDRWPLDLVLRIAMADRAIECLDQIEAPKGHLAYILFLKGQACRASERFEQAIGFLQHANELNPEYFHGYLAIAWCQKRVDRIDLAIEAMESAIELDEGSAIAHYNLACYRAITGDVERTIASLSTALEINADYRENIASEEDFNSIRNDEAFVAAFGQLI